MLEVKETRLFGVENFALYKEPIYFVNHKGRNYRQVFYNPGSDYGYWLLDRALNYTSYIKNIIDEKLKRTGLNNVAFSMRFLGKSEEKELSRWYVITLEPCGFVNFEKREGVFDEDNCQLKIF